MPRKTPEQFWATVDRRGANECWLWKGFLNHGYGEVGWGGKKHRAHRIAYELTFGPIADGLTLDHLCRNKACVNPAHLDPVTHKVNTLRGVGLSAANARKTVCKRGHVFNPENTYVRPSGARKCRECQRIEDRKRKRGKNG